MFRWLYFSLEAAGKQFLLDVRHTDRGSDPDGLLSAFIRGSIAFPADVKALVTSRVGAVTWMPKSGVRVCLQRGALSSR